MKTQKPANWRTRIEPRVNIFAKQNENHWKQDVFNDFPDNENNKECKSMLFQDVCQVRKLEVLNLVSEPMPKRF
jgi:hypothetical protein